MSTQHIHKRLSDLREHIEAGGFVVPGRKVSLQGGDASALLALASKFSDLAEGKCDFSLINAFQAVRSGDILNFDTYFRVRRETRL